LDTTALPIAAVRPCRAAKRSVYVAYMLAVVVVWKEGQCNDRLEGERRCDAWNKLYIVRSAIGGGGLTMERMNVLAQGA
jgi:hypothetical protein